MSEIDPMVEDLDRQARACGAGGSHDDDAILKLQRQLTERLKRPSREEVELAVEVAGNARHQYLKAETDGNLSRWISARAAVCALACGPEPKPRGKRIYYAGTPWLACQQGDCQDCPGAGLGSSVTLCPHDCHKEGGDA